MNDQIEQVSIWSSFDNLVNDAEKCFFDFKFEEALKIWSEYARITGARNWNKTFNDLQNLITDFSSKNITEPNDIFSEWLKLRNQARTNSISSYAFHMMEKLYAKIFLKIKQTVSFDLATGIFCFIDNRIEKAKENFRVAINKQPDNLLAKVFLSKCLFLEGDEKAGMSYLTQAIFLSGNELLDDDIGAVKIKNLYGRLKLLHGKGEIGVWLVPFEAWYRNWLIWFEDTPFFQVMQKKESSERILQVKYYTSEKYRHFTRCLFIAEYVRHFLPKEKGIIWEQEAYMAKLDNNLYERYRRKRKPQV